MRILGLIPARSGSKGLPNKNILPLRGKPLLSWSISAAIESSQCLDVFVSTDSIEYAEIARLHGAIVPFLRPADLASDSATSHDVMVDTVLKFKALGKEYDAVLLLQPTSPLRSSADIINTVDLYKKNQAEAIIGVCEVEHNPLWSNTIPATLSMKEFIRPELANTRRQDLPTYYRINGAIYLISIDLLNSGKSYYGNDTYAYIMPQNRSIDIDNICDFKLAETLLS